MLGRAERFLTSSQRSGLAERYDHVYGTLDGQRAFSKQDIEGVMLDPENGHEWTTFSFVLALETYFAIICSLIVSSALQPSPTKYLDELAVLPEHDMLSEIRRIVAGEVPISAGLPHFSSQYELEWFAPHIDSEFAIRSGKIAQYISKMWNDEQRFLYGDDPIQIIHDAVFPKNLMHVTGQFYTPPWMCDLLASDIDFTHNSKVIDPFCGSGAFLMAALKRLQSAGLSIQNAMRQVCGIDLNPSACIAARTNLVLYAKRAGVKDFSQIPINVLCADSLAPAVAKGTSEVARLFKSERTRLMVAGRVVHVDLQSKIEMHQAVRDLAKSGFATDDWFDHVERVKTTEKSLKIEERAISEQISVFLLPDADVMLTNPPWIGWEYIAKRYRNFINPAWLAYDLFEQTGLSAAFLKEDISTLCIVAACDTYVKKGGMCSIVLRPAAMQSELAARGLRRLSLTAKGEVLKLSKVRLFDDLQVFGNAVAPAASWLLEKGQATQFPIPVTRWSRAKKRWQPDATTQLTEMQGQVEETEAVCTPVDPTNSSSRWAFSGKKVGELKQLLAGSNSYKPRIGFFTGGANAIFYMSCAKSPGMYGETLCKNIIERAKKPVPEISAVIESDLIHGVVRGRDVSFWNAHSEVYVLCPHDRGTRMYPYSLSIMKERFPKAMAYLEHFGQELRDRNGFAGWEKKIHTDNFYTLQRLGDYSFSPYKVCWSYISSDFVIAVVGLDERGIPFLPNDKVVFIGCDTSEEAYFIAAVLSSSPVRLSVISSASSRQISASVLKNIQIPNYDPNDESHRKLSKACNDGHDAIKLGNRVKAADLYQYINHLVASIFNLSSKEVDYFSIELKDKLGFYPFKHPPKQLPGV